MQGLQLESPTTHTPHMCKVKSGNNDDGDPTCFLKNCGRETSQDRPSSLVELYFPVSAPHSADPIPSGERETSGSTPRPSRLSAKEDDREVPTRGSVRSAPARAADLSPQGSATGTEVEVDIATCSSCNHSVPEEEIHQIVRRCLHPMETCNICSTDDLRNSLTETSESKDNKSMLYKATNESKENKLSDLNSEYTTDIEEKFLCPQCGFSRRLVRYGQCGHNATTCENCTLNRFDMH
eukprot:g34591.t1